MKRRVPLLHNTHIGRREALLGAGALFVAGCSKSKDAFTCMDTAGLAAEDAAQRAQVAYVDRTTEVGKNCESCQQYVVATSDGACGTCKLMKGPVHPWGNCKLYAKKG